MNRSSRRATLGLLATLLAWPAATAHATSSHVTVSVTQAPPATAQVGDELSATFRVTNQGPDPVSGLTVSFGFSVQTTGTAFGEGVSCYGRGQKHGSTCVAAGALAPGDSLTLTSTVQPLAGGIARTGVLVESGDDSGQIEYVSQAGVTTTVAGPPLLHDLVVTSKRFSFELTTEAEVLCEVLRRAGDGKFRRVARFTRDSTVGSNARTWNARVAGKRLPAGRYRLRLTPKGANGTGTSVSASFVVPAPKR